MGALQNFQQQTMLTRKGDVSTIRPWMTIPYIASTYHIPESYLYGSLHLTHLPSTPALHHTTLHVLAVRYKRPDEELIHEVQAAILTYRKQHSHVHPAATAPPAHHGNKPTLPGRTTH